MSVKDAKRQNDKKNTAIWIAMTTILFVVLIMGFKHAQDYFTKQADKFEHYCLSDECIIKIKDREYKGKYNKLIKGINAHKGDVFEVIMQCPKKNGILNPVINVALVNSPMTVYVDDKEVYSIGENKKMGDLIGNSRVKIPITNNYAGCEIRIEIKVFDEYALSNIGEITLINTSDADKTFLTKNILNQFFGIFMVGIGILGLLFVLYNFSFHYEVRKELWMSLMSLAGGIWLLACFDILQWWIDSYALKYYIEYESLYFMVLFMVLFTSEGIAKKARNIMLEMLVTIISLYIVVVNILRKLRIIYFQQVLTIFHLIILLSLIIIVFYAIKGSRGKEKAYGIGAFALITVCLAYAISFIFNLSIKGISLSMVSIVILVVDIFLFIEFTMEIAQSYVDNAQRQTLMNMAYKDPLTGIANRRACERYMSSIDDDILNDYIIYSFDIDSLKEVNDRYGHKAGDELIISFANIIKSVFGDNEGFYGRMGGDEFFAAQKSSSEEIRNMITKKLTDMVVQNNKTWGNEFDLSYSYGYSFCDRSKGLTAWITYNIADNGMYDSKALKKEKRNKEDEVKECNRQVKESSDQDNESENDGLIR